MKSSGSDFSPVQPLSCLLQREATPIFTPSLLLHVFFFVGGGGVRLLGASAIVGVTLLSLLSIVSVL